MITRRYHVPAQGLRMALITDLHDMCCGDLAERIRKESPDVIFLAGDILERIDDDDTAEEWQAKINGRNRLMDTLGHLLDVFNSPDYMHVSYGTGFLKEISDIAPVFYSLGNHEWYFTDEDREFFREHGITVLNNADTETHVRETRIRIGGLSTNYDMEWLKEFSRKDGYKILLCHHPEYYRKMIKDTEYDTFDLILGGHYHGGQCRFMGRSMYVPRIGFMKKDAVGRFGRLIISAGAVNTSSLPRLGNPCELVIIEG